MTTWEKLLDFECVLFCAFLSLSSCLNSVRIKYSVEQDDACYLSEALFIDSVNSAVGVGFDQGGSVVSVCVF